MLRTIPIFLLLLPAGSASAALMRYVATEHESQWRTSSSRLSCVLSHEIPQYGRAVFTQAAGGALQLSVEVKRKPQQVGVARLISAAPSWRHGARERDLGQVDYTVASAPFRLVGDIPRRVLNELEQGMYPTLSYPDWADGRDEVQVALSAVNLRRELGEFLDCLAGMVPFSFDTVRYSSFSYAEGEIELGSAEKARLDEVATYLLADTAVERVTIGSYTDNRGYRSANRQVSRRRAERVRDYLIARGVSGKLFSIQAYGEDRPRASNRTAAGRAQNRYLEVTLLK